MTSQKNRRLLDRMKIQSRLRQALEKRGYQEVTTPLLQTNSGADPEIEPFILSYSPLMEPSPPGRELCLHTSPEFAMKRLLASGLSAIYQICPVFRQGEKGTLHSPEFTMAEWYRAGWTCIELMQELERLLVEVIGDKARVRVNLVPISLPHPRITVAQALTIASVDTNGWEDLPPAEWPLDEQALRDDGWSAPDGVVDNWWQERDDPAEVARLMVRSLTEARGCNDAEAVSWHVGQHPDPPGDGEPLPHEVIDLTSQQAVA